MSVAPTHSLVDLMEGAVLQSTALTLYTVSGCGRRMYISDVPTYPLPTSLGCLCMYMVVFQVQGMCGCSLNN